MTAGGRSPKFGDFSKMHKPYPSGGAVRILHSTDGGCDSFSLEG